MPSMFSEHAWRPMRRVLGVELVPSGPHRLDDGDSHGPVLQRCIVIDRHYIHWCLASATEQSSLHRHALFDEGKKLPCCSRIARCRCIVGTELDPRPLQEG